MSKTDVDLGDLLARVLPTEAKVTIRHVSGSPAATEANDFMTVIANEMAMSPS